MSWALFPMNLNNSQFFLSFLFCGDGGGSLRLTSRLAGIYSLASTFHVVVLYHAGGTGWREMLQIMVSGILFFFSLSVTI